MRILLAGILFSDVADFQVALIQLQYAATPVISRCVMIRKNVGGGTAGRGQFLDSLI